MPDFRSSFYQEIDLKISLQKSYDTIISTKLKEDERRERERKKERDRKEQLWSEELTADENIKCCPPQATLQVLFHSDLRHLL